MGGILTLLEELKVDNVIIPKQFEISENYQKFLKIVKQKNIKFKEVEMNERINIEKELYLDILWPNSNNVIKSNEINNNSLVFKLNYKKFSMLFTGDIEEIAEKEILKTYENNIKVLKSNILKVAHHGSKTSSISEFLKNVSPQIAVIGVGENNSFGHPSEITLQTLELLDTKVYRTDIYGEICIEYTKKGKIKTKEKVR